MAHFLSDRDSLKCFWFFMVFDEKRFKMNYFYHSMLISIIFSVLWIFEKYLLFPLDQDFIGIIVFFFIQSIIISWMFVRAQKKVETSVSYLLGATVFRLLSAIFLLIYFILIEAQNFQLLSFEVIGIYLIHLVFELRYVLVNLQRN